MTTIPLKIDPGLAAAPSLTTSLPGTKWLCLTLESRSDASPSWTCTDAAGIRLSSLVTDAAIRSYSPETAGPFTITVAEHTRARPE